MSENLEILARHRDAILIAEIGALLHDLGKLDSRFIIQMSADRPYNFRRYEHERVLRDLPELKNLLSNEFYTKKLAELGDVISELAPLNRRVDLSLDRIISKHHDDVRRSPIGYYKLISPSTRGIDGVDSGIDKGTVSSEAKQTLANTYIATAFGFEEKCIDAAKFALKEFQQEFVEILKSNLENAIYGTIALNKRYNIIQATKTAFVEALGETRRAANDVTLWDHSYSVASLYKAALAKILLDGQWTEPEELQWRFLRISLDGLSFLNSVHRVPDILGRQRAITDALDKVKELLEVEYPLGNEIYRDESGSAFLVPDVSDLLDRVDKDNKSLRILIEDAFAESDLKEEVKLILSPKAFSDASRGAILLGKLLAQPVPPLITNPDVVKGWWDKAKGLEICTVCGLRPQSYGARDRERHDREKHEQLERTVIGCETCKTLARNICYVCLERRGRRSEEWATKGLNSTIWIDEAADINARVALVVGRFQLDDWLNGAFTDTIFTQSLALHNLSYVQLVNGLKDALEGKSIGILDIVGGDAWKYYPEGKKLKSDSSLDEVKRVAEKFYGDVVKERDVRGLSKNVSTLDDQAKLFALFLFRKHPSFARLRRIWETTQGFWQAVRDEVIPEVLAKEKGRRLEIEVQNEAELSRKLGDYHVYDAQLKGLFFSVVWDTKRLITADNLQYLGKLLGKPLQNLLKEQKELPLYEPAGYGMRRTLVATVKIKAIKPLGTYIPAIPILTESRTFIALVPARKALKVVAGIKKKYEIEMSKVRNRLPLSLGIVYFHRRTPLRAALEAGRRMLRMQSKEETWEVKESRPARGEEKARYEGKLGPYVQYLKFEGREMPWLMSYSLGDDSKDYYYPYFFLKVPAQDHPLDQRPNRFESHRPTPKGNERCWLVHVSELKEGDEVWVIPSRFDFEFLDTSARRFEISYGDDGRRHGLRKTRPYLLRDLDVLTQLWELLAGENGLTTTQIDALIGLIEAKREMWHYPTGDARKNEAFEQLVRDALARAEWPNGWAKIKEEDRVLLEKAAISGVLSDVLELYMEVMKERPKRG